MQWLDALPNYVTVGWRETLDILLVALVFHRVMLLVRGTRAVSVIHGVIVVLLAYYLSGEFGLYTLHWLLANFLGSFFLVMVILFQTDIRKALSQVGLRWFGGARARRDGQAVHELSKALFEMARRGIGALVVLERGVPLGDVAARGVELSTRLTRDVLLAVFQHESPLHDGALLVRGGEVFAVACILPLTPSRTLPSQFGTRHRAAVGVTEDTDALVLVVSEERREIRAAQGGVVSEPLDEQGLEALLEREWAGDQ